MPVSIGVWFLIPPLMYAPYSACPKCGCRVLSTANYCSYCGNTLHPEQLWASATVICPKCKSRIPLSAKFCPECGQKQ